MQTGETRDQLADDLLYLLGYSQANFSNIGYEAPNTMAWYYFHLVRLCVQHPGKMWSWIDYYKNGSGYFNRYLHVYPFGHILSTSLLKQEISVFTCVWLKFIYVVQDLKCSRFFINS